MAGHKAGKQLALLPLHRVALRRLAGPQAGDTRRGLLLRPGTGEGGLSVALRPGFLQPQLEPAAFSTC